MIILVVGANGLLGSALVHELSTEHTVYAIVKTKTKISSKQENIHYIEADLLNFDLSQLPPGIDTVYFLAQSNRFREFPDGAMDMLNINIYAAIRMVDWSQKNGVKKFIYASSGGVYKNPVNPVLESSDINVKEKSGFYLDSKLSAEILLKNFAMFFETFVILRPFFMYGPRQDKGMLIPRLVHNIIEGNEIILSSEDGIKINPIYIDDAAKAIKNLLQHKGESYYNIGGNEVVSIRQLSDKIAAIVKKSPVFKIVNNTQADLVADTTKMCNNLFIPRVSLDEGLYRVYKAME